MHKIIAILNILLVLTSLSTADVWIAGRISSDTTWVKNNGTGDGVYVIDLDTDSLVIDPGVTLTIEPGVQVRFYDDVYFFVKGTLIAQGTASDSIVFTTDKTAGSAGEWGGIKLIGDSTTANKLIYCRIEYGDADSTDHSAPQEFNNGGGVFCSEGITSSTEIKHSTFQYNNAYEAGGAIFTMGSPAIESNRIRFNTAGQFAGGIGIQGPNPFEPAGPLVQNCLIYQNSADANGGGGIGLLGYASASVMNTLIYGNSSAQGTGGGVHVYGQTNFGTYFTNSVIWNNSANSSDQVFGTINITYSDVQGGMSGEGNLDADPQFNDPSGEDFHVEATSPIVDSGTGSGAPTEDFDGVTRPFDGDRDDTATVDMGPYEYVNTPPVITSQPDTTALEDETYSYAVVAEDPDAAEQLTYELLQGPYFLSINDSTGEISGMPTTDSDAGSYPVSVRVYDLNAAADTQSYTLTVTAVNDAPQVSDIPDQTIDEGGDFVTIHLDDYVSDEDDSDAEMTWTYNGNNELSVSIVNRVATISVPDSDWYGSETITFTATDPGGLSDADSAVFTVLNINDAPVVSDIPDQTIEEGTSFTQIILDDYVSDVDNADSVIVWTYSGNNELLVTIDDNRVATIQTPDADWNGSETVTFTATDPGGLSDSDNAVFTVTAVNDAPVVSDIPDQTIDEGQSFLAVFLDDYVADVDNPDSSLTWTYSGNAQLIVTISADRIATIAVPDSNWYGAETITFTATDPAGLSDSDPALFTVLNVNDPPVAADDSAATNEDAEVAVYVLNNDSDIDNSALTVASIGVPQHGTATIEQGQYVRYLPDNDWFGTDSFTYVVDDGSGGSDEALVTVSVTAVNDTPVVADIPDQTIEEGGSFISITLDDYVSDVDNADSTLNWTYSGNSALAVQIDENRVATISIPDSNWNGSEWITFTASDPDSASSSDSVLFTVQPTNDAPVVSDIPDQVTAEGTAFAAVELDLYVDDIDNTNEEIQWTVSGNIHLEVQIDSLTHQASVSAIDSNWFGSETLVFTATDPGGLSDSDSSVFTVTPVNDAPIVLSIPDQTIQEDSVFATISLDDYVTDIDDADSAIVWVVKGNKDLQIQIDNNRIVTISVPYEEWNGSETVWFSATDTSGLSDSTSATFTVLAVNDAPQITAPLPELSFPEDDSLYYAAANWYAYVQDNDNADSTLNYAVSGGSWVVASSDSGGYLFNAPENWFGSDTLLLKVSDGSLSDSAFFIVTVRSVNDAPVIVDLPDSLSFRNDSSLVLVMKNYGVDIETADSLLGWEFTSDNDSLLYVYDPATTKLTLEAPGFSGMVSLICTVQDDSAATATDTIFITVSSATAITNADAFTLPKTYQLGQNYPNPFNPTTRIKYALPKAGKVRIEVYNIAGQRVAVLVDEFKQAGRYETVFKAGNLSSGMYFYRIQSGSFSKVKRMILLK